MKLVEFRNDAGALLPGLIVDNRVIDLTATALELGIERPPTRATGYLPGSGSASAQKILEAAPDSRHVVPDADLGPAVAAPPKLLCLAGNYQSHIEESGSNRIDKAKSTPRFFIKPNSSIIGASDTIRIPEVSDTVDYEIEIAAVIGKGGKSIPAADAASHIGGYVVFNDISARDLNVVGHRTERKMDDFFDWLVGKWCDSFAVVGPWLVTSDEIYDPTGLEMALHVNGELRQHSSAGEMIFTVPEAIAWISRFLTLETGDMICMGTPGGVGATTSTWLKAGDTVTATIEQLGALENPVG